jgi:signal transduction histidine kinase
MRASFDTPGNSAPRSSERVRDEPKARYAAVEEISGASRRLRALAALSGSLTDALSPEDAASLVQQKALSALGATSAVVVTLGAFPPAGPTASSTDAPPATATLNVVHTIGLPAEVRAALHQLPLNAPVPFAEVARTGEPLFLASVSDLQRYPDWGNAMIEAGSGSAAIVPVWANGELRGVLGLAWPAARTFDQDERAFVLTLGVMCAQAIMRAHLREAEVTARREAERANQSKAHFVATISHELRTPMNAVLGYTDLLADEVYGPVSALQKDHLGRVRASGTHLLALIEDLLGYARIEAGEEVVRPEHVLLDDIIEQSLLLVRPMAEKKGLSIGVNTIEAPARLHTDPRKLCQILVNLLANAVKFTDAGTVILRVCREESAGPSMVHFEVTDPGCGITDGDRDHIFEPFWQAGPLTPHPSGSTGLGLSVARELARLMGGDIALTKSALDEGCTFVASLPTDFGARHIPSPE